MRIRAGRARAGRRAAMARNGVAVERRRRLSLAATLAILFGCIVAEPAAAQPGGNGRVLLAQAGGERSFSIAPQPLSSAILQFREQSGLQIAYKTDEVRGLQTQGVTGTLPPEDALRRLLAGTGLIFEVTADRTVTIAKVSGGPGAITLDPVTVEGKAPHETAFGPVDGYVATRNSTGAKTDTPISEIPQSVSVITRDEIDGLGARTVGDALAYTAGVVAGTQGESSGAGGDSISIRGFGGRASAGISDNEYWDGLRMLGTNFAAGHIDPYFFERIEVLRGPTSVLYGQNQPGGIVNRVSKRPLLETRREVQVLGGSFDTKELDVDLGGRLTEGGAFSYRVVGLLSDQDGQRDFTGRVRKAVAPSLTWRPTAHTSVTLHAVYQKDDIDGGFLQSLPAQGTVFNTPNGRIARERFVGDPNFDKWDAESYAVGYFLDHRFDDTWSFRQNARFFHNKQDIKSVFLTSLQSDGRTVDRSTFAVVDDSAVFTIDNQAEARFQTGAVAHKLLVGADFQRQQIDDVRGFGFGGAPPLDLYDPVYNQSIPEAAPFGDSSFLAHQVGLYVQDQIKLDRWILTLGGRRDWADSKSRDNLTESTATTKDTDITGRTGLGYAFAFGLTPYVSYSQSFEPVGGTDFFGARFASTTGTQYEAGLKYEPVGHNAFVTVSAFDLTQQNVLTGDPDHPGFSIQTGEVRSRGIELEGVASLENGWGFIASYSYLDQEVTESNGPDLGKRPTRMPRHKAALWGSYAFSGGPLTGLQVGAGVRYIGETAGDGANTFEVPAYTLFDAAVKYDLSALDVRLKGAALAVNATNIADNTYVAACDADTVCYYGIGRTVIGRLKYQW